VPGGSGRPRLIRGRTRRRTGGACCVVRTCKPCGTLSGPHRDAVGHRPGLPAGRFGADGGGRPPVTDGTGDFAALSARPSPTSSNSELAAAPLPTAIVRPSGWVARHRRARPAEPFHASFVSATVRRGSHRRRTSAAPRSRSSGPRTPQPWARRSSPRADSASSPSRGSSPSPRAPPPAGTRRAVTADATLPRLAVESVGERGQHPGSSGRPHRITASGTAALTLCVTRHHPEVSHRMRVVGGAVRRFPRRRARC
jgi:hypothetical protein